ncbi:hypothetical protein, partial [Gemmobacter sp. 24YEA27]|uniref:hypothetical protein n=1 Tax=Gemmobacter sp. 24YEA27 TaxID=3040672 RepID=UPI0024B33EEA
QNQIAICLCCTFYKAGDKHAQIPVKFQLFCKGLRWRFAVFRILIRQSSTAEIGRIQLSFFQGRQNRWHQKPDRDRPDKLPALVWQRRSQSGSPSDRSHDRE